MYQKEIIYMGLYKDGSRIGNAGFLKVENKDTGNRLNLNLRNIPSNISGRFPIRVYNGTDWKEINGISVQEGGGKWEENLSGRAPQIRLQITLPGGYFLEGKSKNAAGMTAGVPQREPDRMPESAPQKEPERMPESAPQREPDRMPEGMPQREADRVPESAPQREPDRIPESTPQREPERIQASAPQREPERIQASAPQREPERIQASAPQKITGRTTENTTAKGTIGIMEDTARSGPAASTETIPEELTACSLKEDKWEQILDSYEQIHPYGDERVYVKLEPKDFIILQSKYQHLVNNSFLLHGFYNYRYVILGKENGYYLGVPGVFYEREKMVALMFGFEAFECPGGMAKAGEFGYYLRKVEL